MKNKGLARVLVYFFILVFIVGSFSCSSGDDNNNNNSSISQADLQGTWNIQRLESGSTNAWGRYNVTINSSGNLTFNSCKESSGSTTCPTHTIVWTIDEDTGVITETDNGTATDAHFAIASNGKFIAGTSSGSSQLFIAQKKVSGTTYSASDVQSKSWVFHELSAGANPRWSYGNGTIAANGAMTITNETDPSGTDTPGATGITIAVNASGIVTMTGGPGAESMATYQGFLSDDKKTIVGTYTDSDEEYRLLIIQITTGQTGSSTSQIAGISRGHMLAVGVSPAPFWSHDTMSITSGGVVTPSDWVCSNAAITASTASYTLSIGSTGTATITIGSSDWHGQLSYDGTFLVGTQTVASGIYALNVVIINNAEGGGSSSSSSSSSSTTSSSSTGSTSSSTGSTSSSTGSTSSSTGSTSSSTGSTSSSTGSTSSSTGSSSSSSSTSSSSTGSSSTSSSGGGSITEIWSGTFQLILEDPDPISRCRYTQSGNITVTLPRNGTSFANGTNVVTNYTQQVTKLEDDAICMQIPRCDINPSAMTGTVNVDGDYNFSIFKLDQCIGDFTNVLGTVNGTRMTGTKTVTDANWGSGPFTFDIVKQ